MKRLSKTQYTFGFTTTDQSDFEEHSNKIFNIISNPSKVEETIGESSVYNQFFNYITHEEDDFVCWFYETIEFVNDFDDVEDEHAFLVGFDLSNILSEDELKQIYNDLLIPLFEKITDKVKPTGRILIHEEYIETVNKTIEIN